MRAPGSARPGHRQPAARACTGLLRVSTPACRKRPKTKGFRGGGAPAPRAGCRRGVFGAGRRGRRRSGPCQKRAGSCHKQRRTRHTPPPLRFPASESVAQIKSAPRRPVGGGPAVAGCPPSPRHSWRMWWGMWAGSCNKQCGPAGATTESAPVHATSKGAQATRPPHTHTSVPGIRVCRPDVRADAGTLGTGTAGPVSDSDAPRIPAPAAGVAPAAAARA